MHWLFHNEYVSWKKNTTGHTATYSANNFNKEGTNASTYKKSTNTTHHYSYLKVKALPLTIFSLYISTYISDAREKSIHPRLPQRNISNNAYSSFLSGHFPTMSFHFPRYASKLIKKLKRIRVILGLFKSLLQRGHMRAATHKKEAITHEARIKRQRGKKK